MFTLKDKLKDAEQRLDETPVALYIEPAKNTEQEIWFLKEISHLPYPIHWFEEDVKRTHAMYNKHYAQWKKGFMKQHLAYIEAKHEWERCLQLSKTLPKEADECWPSY